MSPAAKRSHSTCGVVHVRLDVHGFFTRMVGGRGIDPSGLEALRPCLERVPAGIAARRSSERVNPMPARKRPDFVLG